MRNRHKGKVLGSETSNILPFLGVVVAVVLLLVYVFYDRTPPQDDPIVSSTDSAVVLPFDAGSFCPDIPEVTPTPTPKAKYDPYPSLGEKIGTITIESLGSSWPIYQGTNPEQLSLGVGHYVGSVLPGVVDNSILSGHRSTVFTRFGELQIGNQILVETAAGIFTYEITEFKVVDRNDQTVIQPSEDAQLTLTTCYPFGQITATDQAYIVTSKLISSEFKKD